MPITQEELASRIRRAREACRLTQEQVGESLDVSRSTVAQIEAGNRAVSSLELDQLAHLFGRDIREFVAETFDEEAKDVDLPATQPEVVSFGTDRPDGLLERDAALQANAIGDSPSLLS